MNFLKVRDVYIYWRQCQCKYKKKGKKENQTEEHMYVRPYRAFRNY
jgi:hypothetical protein